MYQTCLSVIEFVFCFYFFGTVLLYKSVTSASHLCCMLSTSQDCSALRNSATVESKFPNWDCGILPSNPGWWIAYNTRCEAIVTRKCHICSFPVKQKYKRSLCLHVLLGKRNELCPMQPSVCTEIEAVMIDIVICFSKHCCYYSELEWP